MTSSMLDMGLSIIRYCLIYTICIKNNISLVGCARVRGRERGLMGWGRFDGLRCLSDGVFLFFILALWRSSPCAMRGTDESSREQPISPRWRNSALGTRALCAPLRLTSFISRLQHRTDPNPLFFFFFFFFFYYISVLYSSFSSSSLYSNEFLVRVYPPPPQKLIFLKGLWLGPCVRLVHASRAMMRVKEDVPETLLLLPLPPTGCRDASAASQQAERRVCVCYNLLLPGVLWCARRSFFFFQSANQIKWCSRLVVVGTGTRVRCRGRDV